MIYKIIVEPEAFEDLINIKTYITREDSITKAQQFLSELQRKIKTLSSMPNRCRKSLYTDAQNAHDLIYKKYTIVYKIIDDTVHILTIFKQRNYAE
jgi:plasmid stabilization system protein ParE